MKVLNFITFFTIRPNPVRKKNLTKQNKTNKHTNKQTKLRFTLHPPPPPANLKDLISFCEIYPKPSAKIIMIKKKKSFEW